ncbi:hypothetical protein [Ectopseudomonas mendocina]|uniref:hypothetical protein n=1 Tax=Ectopseudomonas mendocina TaxID=300 RepID=UPI003F12BC49
MTTRLDKFQTQAADAVDTDCLSFDLAAPVAAVQWDDCTHTLYVCAQLKELYGNGWDRHLPTAIKTARQYLAQYGTLGGWSPMALGGKSLSRQIAELDKKHAAERRELFKLGGYSAEWATKTQVGAVIQRAHDCAFDPARPSASALFREQGVTGKQATKFASKYSIHLEAAWDSQAQHPTRLVMQEQKVMTRRKSNAAKRSSVAGAVQTLYASADHVRDRRRLDALEAETAELRRQLEQHTQRLEIVEAGEHWHGIAKRMRAGGSTYGAIAKATGQKLDTVKKYIQRNA